MKYVLSLMAILASITAVCPVFAQESKAEKRSVKSAQTVKQQPQMFYIISRIAKGTRLESQDAKNVSFTLKPTRAFITIEF